MTETLSTLAAALALAVVHLFSGRLRFLRAIPRSRWLSAAGGVSVAYIFVHVLPELAERQQHFSDLAVLRFLEHHIYGVALVGFAAFYGLERLAQLQQTGRDNSRQPDAPDHEPEPVGPRDLLAPRRLLRPL